MLTTIQPVPTGGFVREPPQLLDNRPARAGAVSPFCEFLREQGGIHLWFAEFLKWRSDLLRSGTLLGLQSLPAPSWSMSREEARVVVQAEFGDADSLLSNSLSASPCWSSGFNCAYRARADNRDVVFQFNRPAFHSAEFAALERSLARWKDEALEGRLGPEVMSQFLEWTRAGAAPSSGRRLLEAAREYSGSALTAFPEPIVRLCSDRVLGYAWLEGQPLDELLAGGHAEALQKWFETTLEQLCLFSVVDADGLVENLVVTPEGRIGLRFPPRFIAIPAVHVRRMLKYLSSVFAGNVPAGAHALLKLSGSETADDVRMLDALASVEPDLKVNLAFPVSAGQFENQWRALAVLQPARPLFLDCLHRNLIAAGYAASKRQVDGDPLEQAHWPVLGRLLRSRTGDLLTRESASDWLLGSGLLMVEAMQQIGRLAEDFRDDDVSLRVNLASSGSEDVGQRSADRSAALLIIGGFLLAVLVLSLRWGFALSGPLGGTAAVCGVLAAVGLFLVVSHIE